MESLHLGSLRSNEQRAGKVVYVDDLGLMLVAVTPKVLMKKVPTALDCLGEHCERHGLRVNYQPGKTEIMLHLSGQDQGKLKAKVVADGNEIHTPGGLHVRVVNSYVHLGSTMGDDNVDVERRQKCVHAVVRSDCTQRIWELMFQGERSSQPGKILVFLPSLVRLVFLVTMCSSKTQRWLHEGATKDRGAAKTQSRPVGRRESPRVPQHARDSLLYLAE